MATGTTRHQPTVPTSIAPIPRERRTLSPLDVGILWNDLSLGLLVLVTGGSSSPRSTCRRRRRGRIGTVLGCLPLAAVASPAREASRAWCCSGRSWGDPAPRSRRC